MATLREIIEEELSKKRLTHSHLIQRLGITEPAYYQMLKRDSTKKTTLIRIAEELNIPKEKIFREIKEEDPLSTGQADYWKNKYEESQEKIKHLVNTIQLLSLGKFNTVPFSAAYVASII